MKIDNQIPNGPHVEFISVNEQCGKGKGNKTSPVLYENCANGTYHIQDVAETYKSIEKGNIANVECPECGRKMVVGTEAHYVLCKDCQTVFPR